MRRLVPLTLAVLVLAGCGGSSSTTTTTKAAPRPGPGTVLYRGGAWAVVLRGSKASVQHLVNGAWRTDRSGDVKLRVLGPDAKAARRPQVAVELKASAPLIEEGLWVDGHELIEKGGGLKPNVITVYGAPDGKLRPGKHVAVAYGRTNAHGSAVAWTFTVV